MDEQRRQMRRQARMAQPVRLTMQDMAVIRESLIRTSNAINAAVDPFGLVTTWDATARVAQALGKITEARCDLKRRQHPDYNPAMDSECEGYATDADFDRLTEAQRAELEARFAARHPLEEADRQRKAAYRVGLAVEKGVAPA
jgi:hypothetical protein